MLNPVGSVMPHSKSLSFNNVMRLLLQGESMANYCCFKKQGKLIALEANKCSHEKAERDCCDQPCNDIEARDAAEALLKFSILLHVNEAVKPAYAKETVFHSALKLFFKRQNLNKPV